MYGWSWTSVLCPLFCYGCIGGAWTADVTVGDNATLSWYLPEPTNKDFTVWNTRSGKPVLSITNYNDVTDTSLESAITFTGNISPLGTGLFRFVVSDVKFHDEGHYECYVGPPDNRGFNIDNCGQTLIVMAASTVFIRFGETTTLAWNLHGSGMREFWVRNDFWKKTCFHITNYNQVNIPIKTLRSRITFIGNITAKGIGLFSFLIRGADDHDFGQYSCYKGSPQRPGAKVPNCGQNLAVIRVQEPYIESPDKATVGDSVNLTCHSFLKSYPDWNPSMSFIWSRNGTRVENGGKHKLVSDSWSLIGGRFMTSTLTISGVTKMDRAERYTCQTTVGENLLTDQSIDNVLGISYIPDTQRKITEVQVGDTTLFSMKTSAHQTKVYVIGPTNRPVFEMDSTKIYILEAFWTRIKIMKVITSLDTVAVQFQLSDITSSDAGRYYCSLKQSGQTGCTWEHSLAVSNASVPAATSPSIVTADDIATVPASQSEERSTKGHMTVTTSTVREDLTTVDPITVQTSSRPTGVDAITTSEGLTSTSTESDDLTTVDAITVAASSLQSGGDADTTSARGYPSFSSSSDGLSHSSVASATTASVEPIAKGGSETLSMVSIGLSAATTLVLTVIGVSLCQTRIKRRKASRNKRIPAMYITPKHDENEGYTIIEHI